MAHPTDEETVATNPPVLDSRQLTRIESTHRGFLYQHLYAAGCLLLARNRDTVAVSVERDDDIEIALTDERLYLQLKTRTGTLSNSDVTSNLERFDELREAHLEGKRAGTPRFYVISNAPPSPKLLGRLTKETWADDVEILWPGKEATQAAMLPPAWADVSSGIEWCSQLADQLPFLTVPPRTLVLKLAGLVTLAASGSHPYEDHRFSTDDLDTLLEQVVVQLQDFPDPPDNYKLQEDEPELRTADQVRLILGFSGSGKSSWAAQAALHFPGPAAYFDLAEVEHSALAEALARELAARFLGSSKGRLGELLLPGSRGLDLLRAVDRELQRDGVGPVLIIDNAHRLESEELGPILSAIKHTQILVLAQPSQSMEELSAAQSISVEELGGWGTETIAAVAAEEGVSISLVTAETVREVTGGLPLFVLNLIQLSSSEYGGDLPRFLGDLQESEHTAATLQEQTLDRQFRSLGDATVSLAAAIAVSSAPVTQAELVSFGELALDRSPAEVMASVRSLRSSSLIQRFGDGRMKLHDAVRVLGKREFAGWDGPSRQRVLEALRDTLLTSLQAKPDPTRLGALIKLLVETGDIETVVGLAGNELFHEMGLVPLVDEMLERACAAEGTPATSQFWALDVLCYRDLQEGNRDASEERLQAMEQLIASGRLGDRERLALALKRLSFVASHTPEDGLADTLRTAIEIAPTDPEHQRILKYTVARSLFLREKFEASLSLSEELIKEYYTHLGLDPETQVFGKKTHEIWPLLDKTDSLADDLKHLGDTLDVFARCSNRLGMDSGLARIHAMKFYSMANAVASTFNVAQDAVDEFLRRGDPEGARLLMVNNVLPAARRIRAFDRLVPLRAQYAVVLAHCNRFDEAEEEIASLAPLEETLDPLAALEMQNQRRGIAELRRNAEESATGTYKRMSPKIGRNDPCPCGSGKKYKKCCV